jgi:signal transduction histidine kinase
MIREEGAGFDGAAGTNGQGGILNIQQRLILMECQKQIHSNPSKGTQVMMEIPKQEVK